MIVGVNEQADSHLSHGYAQVYPNPATDQVTITCSEVISDIAIHDVSGRILINRQSISSESTQLDVSTLPAGVYPTMITTLHGIEWQMMVKR